MVEQAVVLKQVHLVKKVIFLTGYFNIPKVLEITLNNGIDPRTKKNIGIKTGDPTKFKSFDDLLTAFEKQLNHFIDIKIQRKSNN